MRGEDDPRTVGHLVQLLNEDRAAALEILDDVSVVHDLATHVDRCAEAFERGGHRVDGPLHARAERARGGEQDLPGVSGGRPRLHQAARRGAACAAPTTPRLTMPGCSSGAAAVSVMHRTAAKGAPAAAAAAAIGAVSMSTASTPASSSACRSCGVVAGFVPLIVASGPTWTR